jgi:WD40 repeat protein
VQYLEIFTGLKKKNSFSKNVLFFLNRIKISDNENGRSMSTERSMKVHKKSVRGIGLNPDGEIILTVSKDKSIKLRSTETGKMITKYKRAHEYFHFYIFSKILFLIF